VLLVTDLAARLCEAATRALISARRAATEEAAAGAPFVAVPFWAGLDGGGVACPFPVGRAPFWPALAAMRALTASALLRASSICCAISTGAGRLFGFAPVIEVVWVWMDVGR
jgi:hypothetical protein